MTDAGLAHLKGLTNLEVLRLMDTGITDDGLVSLAGLGRLTSLDLGDTHITLTGLRHLLPLKGLTSLDLAETRLDGDPIPVLAHFRKLRKLRLDLCREVGDDNLKELARRLPSLREVSLRRTGVTRFRLAQLLPTTKWKKVHVEVTMAVCDTDEMKEVEAFEAFCRDHDVLIEVDYE